MVGTSTRSLVGVTAPRFSRGHHNDRWMVSSARTSWSEAYFPIRAASKATTVDVSTGGRVDLAAYFVRRGFDLLRPGGNLCFITTNTIGQGDTREASLTPIATTWGGELVDAVRSEPWEGEATVSVAIVHIHRGPWEGDRTLDGRTVDRIAADLSASQGESEPVELAENDGIVSVGTNVLGEGFWIDADERRRLIDDDPRNADVIKPFIGGRQAMQASDPGVPIRWVIDFGKGPRENYLSG